MSEASGEGCEGFARAGPADRAPRHHRSNEKVTGSIDDLRRLVLGPERTRRLDEGPFATPEVIARVLPEAIANKESQPEKLAISLEPAVTTVMHKVARRDVDLFAEILSPSIGAAVRKAVREALAVMLQRLNEALERSFSIQSFKWRVEARRTHRPFAEVVLLRTLQYQVEQVFLIHPESGLVLEHVVAAGAGVQDPDQVSSMLEAVDSFVRDAFRPQPADAHMTSIEFGDLTLWIDRDRSLAIAAVVRGNGHRELSTLLRETRERIYLTHREELARFQSNVAPFASTRPELERLLLTQHKRPPERAQKVLAIAAAILAVLSAGWIYSRWAEAADHARRLDSIVAALTARPGTVILSAAWEQDRALVVGMRDPSAAPPTEEIAKIDPAAELRFQPFYSLDPALVLERAQRSLDPPPTVELSLRAGVLVSRGHAPRSWVDHASDVAPLLPGIERFDAHDLGLDGSLEPVRAEVDALEAIEIPFRLGSSILPSEQTMGKVESRVRALLRAAEKSRLPVCIAVLGHADAMGSAAFNQRLSRARAKSVARELFRRGILDEHLQAAGIDGPNARRTRSVTFEVEPSECAEAGR